MPGADGYRPTVFRETAAVVCGSGTGRPVQSGGTAPPGGCQSNYLSQAHTGFMEISDEDILRNVESLSQAEQLRLISEAGEYMRLQAAPEARTSILDL